MVHHSFVIRCLESNPFLTRETRFNSWLFFYLDHFLLPIFGEDFEVGLRVGAGGAHAGRFFGFVDESAVTTAPDDFAVFLEYFARI